MKKRGLNEFSGGFSTVIVVVAVIAVAVLAIVIISIANNQKWNYTGYSTTEVIGAEESNGWIGDHVRGNSDAPVKIVEYLNYGCSHCAAQSPVMETLVERSNGQLGVIVRNVQNSGFPNSKSAAAAAEAAGLQGYWEKYATKLLEEQNTWNYASADERENYYVQYFKEVTDGNGDVEKFLADMKSDEVAAKMEFDHEMSKMDKVSGTPMFYIEGQKVESSQGGQLMIDDQAVEYGKLSDENGLLDADKYWELIEKILAVKNGTTSGSDAGSVTVESETQGQ